MALDSAAMLSQLLWFMFLFFKFVEAPSGNRTRDLLIMRHERYHITFFFIFSGPEHLIMFSQLPIYLFSVKFVGTSSGNRTRDLVIMSHEQ
jgi:hypothetical protein